MEDSMRETVEFSKMSYEAVIRRFPRLVGHIIAHSLGYATPSCAAGIIRDAKTTGENWCEWCYSCYRCDAKALIRHAISCRHGHNGYMGSYIKARAIVEAQVAGGGEPLLASWF
jgi:hypothetical protein